MKISLGGTVRYNLIDGATWDVVGPSGRNVQSSEGTISSGGSLTLVSIGSTLGGGVGDFELAAATMEESERKLGLRQRQPDRTAADGSPVYLFAGSRGEDRTYEIGGYIEGFDYLIGITFTGPIDPTEADALVDSLIATIGPA